MTLTRALMDSSFLYALFEQAAPHHAEVNLVARTYALVPMMPHVVLGEVAFLFNRTGGAPAMVRFLDSFAQYACEFEEVNRDDLKKVRQLLLDYPRAKLDFVDCCIMAIAERLNISQICTLDQRDFHLVRPDHCAYFELLP